MILSRLLSFVFRGLEFVCAIIILGLGGHFIWRMNRDGPGPRGRLIYTEVVATFAALLSLIWLVPFTWTFLHYPMDIILSLAFFASFGALFDWIHINGLNCSGIFGVWNWDGNSHNNYCAEWKTLEAFTFMSGVFWLISAFLSIHVFHRVRGRNSPKAITAA
ncbi:integral membrane protein [Microthyrium microscopicum]|uniref:Integral membrane protein n=1 Tax=Microthyrium microscopicum TaxID=703497 RepID=A0A6A6UHA3_9PEZI|nr:integral membrane protein [Microthyrium microscopicum]